MNLSKPISIIGSGSRASIWAEKIKESKYFNLQSFFSRDEKSLKSLSEKFNCEYYTDLSKFLNKRVSDNFVIANRTQNHDICLNFLKESKNFIIEKPLSLSETSLDLIIQEYKKSNSICISALNRYYDTYLKRVKKIIEDGKIGNIINVNFTHTYFLDDDRINKRIQNDVESEFLNIHIIDQLNFIFGEPIELFARETKLFNKRAVNGQVQILYPKNIICNLVTSARSKIRSSVLEIFGTSAKIEINFIKCEYKIIENPYDYYLTDAKYFKLKIKSIIKNLKPPKRKK